jgi:subtilase family serine protease
MAQPVAAPDSLALAGLHTDEAPRITQSINSQVLSAVANSHLKFVGRKAPIGNLADATPMNHMQLVLKRSALRETALAQLVTDQHNPKSASFRQWLTPQQFGDAFGVSDADLAAITSWLVSQGFTVNGVYPNKMQIDFSGNAGQVRNAFHTQEAHYKLKNGTIHRANAGNISIPRALNAVVVGVAGLNDFHPEALHKQSTLMQWNVSGKNGFDLKPASNARASNAKGQAITLPNASRALVPNDLARMYNVMPLRANGVTGSGVTIAVVDAGDIHETSWKNFVTQFNLGEYGGTLSQIQPSGPSACTDPGFPINQSTGLPDEDGETLLDAEWSTAMAPGANIVIANCSWGDSGDFFGGVFAAATNLINAGDGDRPNIISASYGYGEYFTDPASKTAIDLMWTQADAEGISVFVSTGDSGSNPSFNGGIINGYYGNTAVDANSFATSANVTAVGGTDTADVLDGTTRKYFAPNPSVVGGTALGYVPEIPWNQSCGNGVAAKWFGFNNVVDFCKAAYAHQLPAPYSPLAQSEAASGGPSSVVLKPAWQRQVFNAAHDQSRDLPDVSLFAGSFGGLTWAITCTSAYPCNPDFTGFILVSGGTSLSAPMFAGIQAVIDQGLAARGLPLNQGNAAPTLYALAAKEYGDALGAAPASLATCNADNGTSGTQDCVFHNVTRGAISSNCYDVDPYFTTSHCYYYLSSDFGGGATGHLGLTTTDANPTSYGPANKAFGARPGWSFASGLGSVDAKNLLIAWRAFVGAPPATLNTIETYDDGKDLGEWIADQKVPRVIATEGGNPGYFLEQANMANHLPTWGSASPRYQPGVNDKYKNYSAFTGDWTDARVVSFSADMKVIQDGGWATDRGVTLELVAMDDAGIDIVYQATYTIPLPDTTPVGWHTYSFPVNANAATVPNGWVFTLGDGVTPAPAAEWSKFLKRVDLTTIGFYKPWIFYTGLSTWTVGIDNVTVRSSMPAQ